MDNSSSQLPARLSQHRNDPELKLMRQRVNYLSKENSRQKKITSGTYENLLKIIDNKLNHDEVDLQKQSLHKTRQDETQQKHQKVKNMRTKLQEELRHIKHCYRQLKREETSEVKAMKQNNRSLAQRLHSEDIVKKQQKIQSIKLLKDNWRSINLHKFEEKKANINRLKLQRQNMKQKHKQQVEAQMRLLQKKEKDLLHSLNTSVQHERIVEGLVDRTHKMTLKQFHRVLAQISVDAKADRNKLKIIMAQQLIKNGQQNLLKGD